MYQFYVNPMQMHCSIPKMGVVAPDCLAVHRMHDNLWVIWGLSACVDD